MIKRKLPDDNIPDLRFGGWPGAFLQAQKAFNNSQVKRSLINNYWWGFD
jgi:hypothetical protein